MTETDHRYIKASIASIVSIASIASFHCLLFTFQKTLVWSQTSFQFFIYFLFFIFIFIFQTFFVLLFLGSFVLVVGCSCSAALAATHLGTSNF